LYYLLQQFGISVATPPTEHLREHENSPADSRTDARVDRESNQESNEDYDEYYMLERDADDATYIEEEHYDEEYEEFSRGGREREPDFHLVNEHLLGSEAKIDDAVTVPRTPAPDHLRADYDTYDTPYVGSEDDSVFKGQGEFEADPKRHIRGRHGEPDSVALDNSPSDAGLLKGDALADPFIDVHDDRRIEVLGPFDDCFLEFHKWTIEYQKTYSNDDAYNAAHQNFKHTKSVVLRATEYDHVRIEYSIMQHADLDEDARNQAMFGSRHTVTMRTPSKDRNRSLPHGLWTLFHHWTVKHLKIYNDAQTLMDRFDHWKHNNAFILEHNDAGDSVTVGHNQWSDKTQEEMRAIFFWI